MSHLHPNKTTVINLWPQSVFIVSIKSITNLIFKLSLKHNTFF
jgi:hypothetical protein